MDNQFIFSGSLALGLGLALSLLGAFGAGRYTQECAHLKLDLAKLKVKTSAKLQHIYEKYVEEGGPLRLPEDFSFNIVENLPFAAETLQEEILGLTDIY